MNSIVTFLESNRQRFDLERYGAASHLSCVMLTPRFRASSHVVFLVLAGGKPDPVLVAKVPRLTSAIAAIEREVANLRAIDVARPDWLDSIPRVVAYEECHGRPVLVETALIGHLMDPTTVRRDLAGCCAAVSAWLCDTERSHLGEIAGDASWYERLVERPLRHFGDVFPLSTDEMRLMERTWALMEPLRGTSLPVVVEHGDLSHPNIILREHGGVGVVDWELADVNGVPACDLYFFLVYAAFALSKARASGDYVSSFHTAFFGRTAWARPYVTAYAEALQLSLHLLTPLFVLCWARYTVGLLRRLGGAGVMEHAVDGTTAAWLRTNRYYALWRHAVDHVDELDWSNGSQVKPRSISIGRRP
jgi:aminoglycoside phosphotransferase